MERTDVTAGWLPLAASFDRSAVERTRGDAERRDLGGKRHRSAEHLRLRKPLLRVDGERVGAQSEHAGGVIPNGGRIAIDRGHRFTERHGAWRDRNAEERHAVDAAVGVPSSELRLRRPGDQRRERDTEKSYRSVHDAGLSE